MKETISVILFVCLVIGALFINHKQTETETIDYRIIINKDSIKLLDKNNKIIYKDTFNENLPKLETAIINDNL